MALNNRAVYTPKKVAPATERCPTMGVLMSDPGPDAVRVRIPKITRATKIRFEPIRLNKHVFMPGETYTVHPLIAAELETSIDNYEQSIVRQMTGNSENNQEIIREFAAQDAHTYAQQQPRAAQGAVQVEP